MAGTAGDEWIYVPSKQEDAEAEQQAVTTDAATAEEKVEEDVEAEQAVTTDAVTATAIAVGQENSKPSKNPDEDHHRREEEEEEEEFPDCSLEKGFTPEELETLEKLMEQVEMDKAVEALDRANERIVRGTHLESLESAVYKTYEALTTARAAWAASELACELAVQRLQVARREDRLEYDRALRAYQLLCERHRTSNDVDGGAADASSDTGGGGPAAAPRDARVMDDLIIGPNSSAPASPALFSGDYDNRYGYGYGFGPGMYRSPATGLGGYYGYGYGSGFGFPVAYRNPATATGLGNGFPAGGPATGPYYGGYADPYQAPGYKTVMYQAPPPALFASSSTLAPAPAPAPAPQPLQPRPYVYTTPEAPDANVPSSSLGPFSEPNPPAVAAPRTTMKPLEPINFGNLSFS